MKRELYKNIKLSPYTSGAAIDRQGFLSAVLAASVSVAGTLAVAVTHSDTSGGTYTAVADEAVILYGLGAAAQGDVKTVGIDLIGCKRFIKIAPSGVTATYALALGDPSAAPVED